MLSVHLTWRAGVWPRFFRPLLSESTARQKFLIFGAAAVMVRAKKQRRKIIQRGFRSFCCSCLPSDETDSLQENDMNGEGQPAKRASGEATQVRVEDRGTVNGSFSLLEEEQLTPWGSGACSATSMSVSPRPVRKKHLQPLASLTGLPQANVHSTAAAGATDEEEREEMSIDNPEASGSLPEQPVIHLIPPTPAAVADRARFFDGNLGGSVDPGPEPSKGPGGSTHNVAVRASEGESKVSETQASVDVVALAEWGERPNVPCDEERDTPTRRKQSLASYVAPAVWLPRQHPQRSEPPSLLSPKQKQSFDTFNLSCRRQRDELLQAAEAPC